MNFALGSISLAPVACGGGDHAGTLDGSPAIDAAIDTAPADAPEPLTVQVAKDGDDAHDGISLPVQSLKRAIAIAAANHQVTTIALGAGAYSAQSGEAFPYTVPAGVTIAGPAGGPATATVILAGSGAETGLVLHGGRIQDVTFDSFKLALDGAADLHVKNVHVTRSMLALHGDETAKLQLDGLDIAGSVPSCATGISLEGGADLTATALTTRDLGLALTARNGAGVLELSHASFTTTLPPGTCPSPMLDIAVVKRLTFSDSVIDGGVGNVNGSVGQAGIFLDGLSTTRVPVSFTNVTLQNLDTGLLSLGRLDVQMSGLTLMNDFIGIEIDGLNEDDGTWSFSHATVMNNRSIGIYVRGLEATAHQSVTLRDSTVTGNVFDGILISDHATVDLGTAASPGNNTLTTNHVAGVDITCTGGQPAITAVGNTWQAGTQGADVSGHYPVTATITGPILQGSFGNFALGDGCSMVR